MLKKFLSKVALRCRSWIHGPKLYRDAYVSEHHPYAMSLKDFIDEGFMQEVNRTLLHPAGLHLFFTADEHNNPICLGPIYNYNGKKLAALCFPQSEVDPDKAARVSDLIRANREFRFKSLGYFTQPTTRNESGSDSTD